MKQAGVDFMTSGQIHYYIYRVQMKKIDLSFRDLNIDQSMEVMKDKRIYCVPYILNTKSCLDLQDNQLNN
jgi:hypothetical protein